MLYVCVLIIMADFDPHQVYEVTLPSGRVEYGYLQEIGADLVRLTPDEPWKDDPVARTWKESEISYQPEPFGTRAARLARIGQAAGFENVRTHQGDRWIPINDLQAARRARELAGLPPEPQWDKPIEQQQADTEIALPLDAEGNTPAAAEAGTVGLWLAQAAVIVIGVIALSLVGKYLLIAE